MAIDEMQKKGLFKAGQLTRAQIEEAREIYIEMFSGTDNAAAMAAIIQAVASNYATVMKNPPKTHLS